MQCEEKQNFWEYTVEQDTPLQVLALQLGYHPILLRQANPGLHSYLRKGTQLLLPYRRCEKYLFYRIFPGQTFLSICTSLGLPLEQVMRDNGYLPHGWMKSGQTLLLPAEPSMYANTERMLLCAGEEGAARRLYRNKFSIELFLLLNPQYTSVHLLPGQQFYAIKWQGN